MLDNTYNQIMERDLTIFDEDRGKRNEYSDDSESKTYFHKEGEGPSIIGIKTPPAKEETVEPTFVKKDIKVGVETATKVTPVEPKKNIVETKKIVTPIAKPIIKIETPKEPPIVKAEITPEQKQKVEDKFDSSDSEDTNDKDEMSTSTRLLIGSAIGVAALGGYAALGQEETKDPNSENKVAEKSVKNTKAKPIQKSPKESQNKSKNDKNSLKVNNKIKELINDDIK